MRRAIGLRLLCQENSYPTKLIKQIALNVVVFTCMTAGGLEVQAATQNIEVNVTQTQSVFKIKAHMSIPVSVEVAWSVLTDFKHFPQFLHNVKTVNILGQAENRYRIKEEGEAEWGILSLSYDNVRDIALYPKEMIASKTLSGTVKSMETQMKLTPINQQQIVLDYQARIEPDSWLAELFGASFIQREVTQQFEALATEMQKRQIHGEKQSNRE